MNKVKQKLAAGEMVTMFNPDFASPRLVEYVAGFGLDVAWIDAERMSYDFERIEEMATRASPSTRRSPHCSKRPSRGW